MTAQKLLQQIEQLENEKRYCQFYLYWNYSIEITRELIRVENLLDQAKVQLEKLTLLKQ